MERTVHASGPLTGTVTVPGDRRLMLMTLALGMTVEGQIVVNNAPPYEWTAPFEDFLTRHGASIIRTDDGTVTVTGHGWPDDVRITREVPAEVLHVVAATVLFSGKHICIEGGAGERAQETERMFGLLSVWGLDRTQVVTDGDDVITGDTVLTDPGGADVFTAQMLETALAVSLATGCTLTVSYAPQSAASVGRLAECLGCRIGTPEPGGSLDRDHELTRRLARVKGGRALTTATIGWEARSGGSVMLPGDSMLAAAICGAAAMTPRSKVTVRQVIWEPDRRGFFETLRRMKGVVSSETPKNPSTFDAADVTVQWAPLEGVHVTAEQSRGMLSELPVLAVVAAAAMGKTVVSADSAAMFPGRRVCSLIAAGLGALGAHAGDFEVGIVLTGVPELRGSHLDAGGNPDAALALSAAALAAAGDTVISGITDDLPWLGVFFDAISSLAVTSLPLS